jgi:S-adenosylmethionine synthetase
LKPVFRPTARHGHFGRKPAKVEVKLGNGKTQSFDAFNWEKTDKAAALAKAAGK